MVLFSDHKLSLILITFSLDLCTDLCTVDVKREVVNMPTTPSYLYTNAVKKDTNPSYRHLYIAECDASCTSSL